MEGSNLEVVPLLWGQIGKNHKKKNEEFAVAAAAASNSSNQQLSQQDIHSDCRGFYVKEEKLDWNSNPGCNDSVPF